MTHSYKITGTYRVNFKRDRVYFSYKNDSSGQYSSVFKRKKYGSIQAKIQIYERKPFSKFSRRKRNLARNFMCDFFKFLCVVATVAKQNGVFLCTYGCAQFWVHVKFYWLTKMQFCGYVINFRREIKFGDFWRTYKAAHRVFLKFCRVNIITCFAV